MTEIIKNMIMNISLLALIAYLLTRAKLVKDFIIDDQILSTYTGTPVQGAIVNTRVIGVVAGGILGGPIVGLGAGVIAGLHRYLMDVNGFTSIACGVSTLAEGIIGGLFSKYIKRARNDCVMVGTVGNSLGRSFYAIIIYISGWVSIFMQFIFQAKKGS